MMRIALGIEYDGSGFSGFQWQANARSVQAALEAALSQIAAEPIRVAAAGRTDAGVHATGQVISFSCHVNRPLSAWLRGGNALLPADVKVVWASEVGDDFHARFSAVARRYQYLYDDSATQQLLGEHDFSTFRAAGCQSPTAHRCVHRVAVHRAQTLVVLDITANAFLLHMVRNIAGALLRVGLRQADEDWIGQILAGRNRELAGRTAPPDGLYLVDVHYPGAGLPAGRPAGLLRALGNLDRF
jgi:tRNA pseudouridine38-40 synthase